MFRWSGKSMRLKLSIIILGVVVLVLLVQGLLMGAEKNPIRIAYLQNDIHQLACWVALEKGFYAQEGLEVRVAGIFKAGPELMSGFAAGALDMGYVGVAPVTTAVANKSARVVVLAQVNSEGSLLSGEKRPRGAKPVGPEGKNPGHPRSRHGPGLSSPPVLGKGISCRPNQDPGPQTAGDDRGLAKRGH